MFADTRNLDLFEILKRERAMAGPTTQDQINNRRNAEKIMGPDENLYRIDWVSSLTVQPWINNSFTRLWEGS